MTDGFATAPRPIGHAVDDGGDDDAVIGIIFNGIDVALMDGEAIAVVLVLSSGATRTLCGLPFVPNHVHRDAVGGIAIDLLTRLKIGLKAFDALSFGISIFDGSGFIDANVIFAFLGT